MFPDNIDLWVGGLVEAPLEGAKVGPTFLCIIADQFRRTRNGDRFWYENDGVFTPAQLSQIKQTTLARVVCDNSDNITRVPLDVFHQTDFPSNYIRCDDARVPEVDLKLWAVCCSGKKGDHVKTSHRLV